MQHFRKYELTPTQWATAKKKIELTGNNELEPEMSEDDFEAAIAREYTYWNPELVAVVYEIGKLCTEWGTDEEGNPICIKQNTKVSIDIVWANEPLADFNTYLVWPLPVGVSSMGYSLDAEYAKAYCEANPEAEYCHPPEELV